MLRKRYCLTFLATLLLITSICIDATARETRLGRNVVPTFQAVELDLNADRTEYSGRVRIELEAREKTNAFGFHAREMTLDEIVLTGKSGAVTIEVAKEDETGYVAAATELDRGKYTLEITFSKEYNTKAVGLYRMVKDGQGYLFSQLEAVDARRAFPCFDEPSFKIPFQITINIPEGQEVVTNTPIEEESISDGVRRVAFAKTKPLPTYLLAIAAGPLESVEITGLSVPGRIYTPMGQKHLAGLAVELTPPILEACEEYFGRKYPYAKLDLLAVPEYWPGAMENPGAVTYADHILLVDPSATSVHQRARLAYVTAHELAHMWFGDLVTLAWWDDLWLNESFADWLGLKVASELYPEYGIDIDELGDVQGLLVGDARPSSSPVRKKVESEADILEDLGLAYGKGRTVLGMVEKWIGPKDFRKGVNRYIEKHAWGNAVSTDLFEALDQASGKDVTHMLSGFLEQPGYPLITVSPESGGRVRIEQRRFLNYGVEADNLEWIVPVRLKYFDGTKSRVKTVLLDSPSKTVDLGRDPLWVLPDAGAWGYYRWSVPGEWMSRIAEDPEGSLDARERAVFLANAEALLDAGEIGGGDYLSVLSGLSTVHRPEVIDAVITGLGGIEGAFVTEELRPAFAMYVRRMLRPALDTFGMEPRANEPEAVTLLRPRLLLWIGGRGDDEEVREYCRTVARLYMNDASSVDASLGDVAVRVAMRDGGQAEFDTCKMLFETAAVPSVRTTYLRALGSFEDPFLKKAALEYVLSGKVRPNEMFTIPSTIGVNAAGRVFMWEWMTGNYDTITSRMPPIFASYMPFFASGCERERLEAAEAFFSEPTHSVEGTAKNLQKVIDSTTDCIALREREGASVKSYLSQLLAEQ